MSSSLGQPTPGLSGKLALQKMTYRGESDAWWRFTAAKKQEILAQAGVVRYYAAARALVGERTVIPESENRTMAICQKYGKVDVKGIGADEPIFIIRAQDSLAEAAIDLYRVLATSHGAPVAQSVDAARERFKQWQGKKKLPD